MEKIEHDGIVSEVRQGELVITIVSVGACVSCQVKSVCNPSDAKEKVFEVKIANAADFKAGQWVKLTISEGLGLLAVLLSFILPIVILATSFFVMSACGLNEAIAGLGSLVATAAYFLILYLTRKGAAKKFAYTVSKYED
jgi:sigma-E factor negative regulatory protein RseC